MKNDIAGLKNDIAELKNLHANELDGVEWTWWRLMGMVVRDKWILYWCYNNILRNDKNFNNNQNINYLTQRFSDLKFIAF